MAKKNYSRRVVHQGLTDLEVFLENMFNILGEEQSEDVRRKIALEWVDYLQRKEDKVE